MSQERAHIAVYTDDPEFGGVAHYNHSVLLALVAQGYRVTCIQAESESPLVQQQRAAGVNHEWIGYDAKAEFTRSMSDVADAERVLRRVQPDLVLFSDCCPLSNIAAKHVALKLGLPTVIVIGFAAPYLAQRFQASLSVMSRQHAQAGAVVAVSHENLQLLERQFGTPPGKAFVIHYGRPPAYFEPPSLETRAKLRREMKLPEEAVVCFTAARLTAVKGLQYLVAAAAALRRLRRENPLHFVWAGEGELRSELERQIGATGLRDRFRLLGQRWDVCDLFSASDIFALPSHSEGMPLCVMESMARGVPVIATAVSGIPEELGDTGWLVPDPAQGAAQTVQGLVDGLAAWTSDSGKRLEAARATRERAVRLFREELMLTRITGVVAEVLAAARAGRVPEVRRFAAPNELSVGSVAPPQPAAAR